MQKIDTLIRTKLHLPFIRASLVARPRLQAKIEEGLRGPLTLITAPAGFGKTTLAVSGVAAACMPAAWLSLDKDDNQTVRFLSYLIAALQEADDTIGSGAAKLLATSQEAPPETVLTSLINDLEIARKEIILALDDYQFISSQAVHDDVIFLLEHCPNTLHIVIASRSDPPLPLTRLRARGQTVELRAADLRFTEAEAAQFLNEVMGLHLDAGSIAMLAERTEGWIAGLQMAALSMHHREDILGFIRGFSGTNRYILDYLLEEVLANQPPEIQRFLLHTSILERLSASLCDTVLSDGEGSKREGDHRSADPEVLSDRQPASILEYLEQANLFVVPLDDERTWYRYHHLFADLLRAQLQKSSGAEVAERLHLRAAGWYEQNGSILEAIHHASLASDDELVERLIEQHYMEMVNRGEMAGVRFWMGKLSKEMIYRRPWLCLYGALSRSWFGQVEEATLLLDEAEKRIRDDVSAPGAQAMLGYHSYVKSRVTAMQGDTRQAIELCLAARENIPADRVALQNDVSITLGYEYFLYGDFVNAGRVLGETVRSGYTARAINNAVAAYALLARQLAYQGQLYAAHDLLLKAAQLIQEAGDQYLGATGLVEVETAALLCEWNETEAALVRITRGLDYLPSWGKADDLCLAYCTLWRIHLARGNADAAEAAIDKAVQLIQLRGVFSEARSAVETTRVRMWLVQGDWPAIEQWMAAVEIRCSRHDSFQFEDELAHISQARVLIAQSRAEEAILLLSFLEEAARSEERQGRLIEILLLKALALQAAGEPAQADDTLTKSLALGAPEGYRRVFLDEGLPMQELLARWVSSELADEEAQTSLGALRDYAASLLEHFSTHGDVSRATTEKASPTGRTGELNAHPARVVLVEPLSPRELEVLQLIAQGMTNREIARQLVVAPGTVKAQTSSIYRKLEVSNRTEAAARARQLGILP